MFSFQSQERQYKHTSSVDQLAVHFALDGNMLHKDSDEARRQRQKMGLSDGTLFTSCSIRIQWVKKELPVRLFGWLHVPLTPFLSPLWTYTDMADYKVALLLLLISSSVYIFPSHMYKLTYKNVCST